MDNFILHYFQCLPESRCSDDSQTVFTELRNIFDENDRLKNENNTLRQKVDQLGSQAKALNSLNAKREDGFEGQLLTGFTDQGIPCMARKEWKVPLQSVEEDLDYQSIEACIQTEGTKEAEYVKPIEEEKAFGSGCRVQTGYTQREKLEFDLGHIANELTTTAHHVQTFMETLNIYSGR